MEYQWEAFIATDEAKVLNAYKQAIVDYGAKDIVLTEKVRFTLHSN